MGSNSGRWMVMAVIHWNRWQAGKWVLCYRGWWNEHLVSLVDSWGSTGMAPGLWTQKYEE
jgi:hypothetical protein